MAKYVVGTYGPLTFRLEQQPEGIYNLPYVNVSFGTSNQIISIEDCCFIGQESLAGYADDALAWVRKHQKELLRDWNTKDYQIISLK